MSEAGQQLVYLVELGPSQPYTDDGHPATDLADRRRDVVARELHLQRRLIEANKLLTDTAYEPRLQGRFPQAIYRSALAFGQDILDSLHGLRCLMTRPEWSAVRRDYERGTETQRRELVGNLLLSLSLLSGSVSRRAPLSPFLPPLDAARQRNLDAVRELPAVRRRATQGASSWVLFSAHEGASASIAPR